MNILLVEDEFELGEMYGDQLRRAGHKVKWARHAQAALDGLDKSPTDLVILDILLPLNNGLSFLQEMRSHHDWRGIPVVVLSNIPQEELKAPADLFKNFGIKRYLIKSATSPMQLCEEIENLKIKTKA